MATVLMVTGLAVLLLLQAFFSGSEIAIVNCDRNHLRHRAKQGDAGSKLALRLLERPEVVLSTTLVGTNISLVLLTAIVTATMVGVVGARGELYATLTLIPMTLILGEVVPKSVFQQRADDLTPKIIYPLYGFYLLFFPIVFGFALVARLAARVFGRGDPGVGLFPIRSQLRAVLDTAEGGATIDVFDRTRIRNVVRFGEFVAGDIMVPASEMPALDADSDLRAVTKILESTADLHVPVFEGSRSQVSGLISLSVWDLVKIRGSQQSVRDFVKPALFVPSQQPLVELLPILRSREDQAAVVVDEYGSAIGLITLDRITDTIVGHADAGIGSEEHDPAIRPSYEVLDKDVYLLDARLPVAETNELLGTSLPLSEARTIGGYIIARLRHVPASGEQVEGSGYRFIVVDSNDRAILKLRAEPTG